MRRCAALVLVVGVVGLAGCASLPAPPPAERVYEGRFAASARIDGKAESSSGRFVLRVGRDGALTLDLGSPLGNTLARLELGPDGARLRAPQPDGTLTEARGANGADLTAQLLGYPLPVEGLAHWIDARPAPQRPAVVERADGRIVQIEQDGWIVRVQERFEDGQPRRLLFERDGVTLRLVLDAPPAEATQ